MHVALTRMFCVIQSVEIGHDCLSYNFIEKPSPDPSDGIDCVPMHNILLQ